MDYFIDAIKKYAIFDGRASRKQYWMFVLFNIIFSFVAGFVGGLLARLTTLSIFDKLSTVFALFVLVPGIAIAVRRLHDTSRSGWWYLIGLIPILGWIWIIVLLCLDGTPGTNAYGANPKGVAATAPTPSQSQMATPAPEVQKSTPAVDAPKAADAPAPELTPGAKIGE